MKKLVILPTYNEAKNIKSTVKNIFSQKISNLQILIVDDNSPDGTGMIADRLAIKYKNLVYVIHRAQKEGLGVAYMAGFKWAINKNYQIICEMDSDGSHKASDLPKLINAVKNGADLAIGSRRVKGGKIIGWNWRRHAISWGVSTISHIILDVKQKDITAGFRAYSRPAIDCILKNSIRSKGYSFQVESLWLLNKKGVKIKEIPVEFIDRKLGQSKLSLDDSRELLILLGRRSP